MRTVKEREKMDRRFKRMSKVCKWIKRNVSKSVGDALLDRVYDLWDGSYR